MCTRYLIELSPELRPIIEAAQRSLLASEMVSQLGKKLKTEGEIRPTDMVPVIAPDKTGIKKVYPMVWGFTFPGINRPVVNARSESAAVKKTFREAWKRRRCVIPASWYYEWEHYESGGKLKTGDKYAIQPRGAETTWLAGLYRIQTSAEGFRYPVFTVLTREAAPDLRRIHDRMPVILPRESIDPWIDPTTKSGELSSLTANSLTDLVVGRV